MDKYELMQNSIEKNIQELCELLVDKGITDAYMLMEILEKIDKIEEFLKNKRKDIYSSNLRSETRYETIMLIQDILSIIDGSDE